MSENKLESQITELDVFGCDWNEWAVGIANSEFMKEAQKHGKAGIAEGLAMITVLTITEAQRMVAEQHYRSSVQLLNCLKRMIVEPDKFFALIGADELPPNDQVKH